jgi:hypothetical protein
VNGPQLAHDIAVNRGAFDFSSGARSAQLEREQSAFVLVNIVLWDAVADLSDLCIGFVRCPPGIFRGKWMATDPKVLDAADSVCLGEVLPR